MSGKLNPTMGGKHNPTIDKIRKVTNIAVKIILTRLSIVAYMVTIFPNKFSRITNKNFRCRLSSLNDRGKHYPPFSSILNRKKGYIKYPYENRKDARRIYRFL